jgi:hypothetical protein
MTHHAELGAAQAAKIGDIAEIKTPAGLAYVQYTHDGEDSGSIVRVLPGLFSTRPPDFAELTSQRELYFIFYTLNYALRAGQTEIVSNQGIPDWAKPVPLMRHESGRSRDGGGTGWRIASALAPLTLEFLQQTPVIRELTPEQRKLFIHVIRFYPAMLEELARGWTPERAEELEEQDRAEARARRAGQQTPAPPADQTMRHYLYFPKKSNAEKAAQWFHSQGFSVETKRSADGENRLTLVKHSPPANQDSMDKLHDEMKALASQLHGEYDGWEMAV